MDSEPFVKEFEEAQAADAEAKRLREESRKTKSIRHSLMIIACVMTMLFGITAKLAVDSSQIEVDAMVASEIKNSINDIVTKINESETTFGNSLVSSGEIITKEYAEKFRKSAFAVVECGSKINDEAQYKRMTDLGGNTVKVEVFSSNDDIQILMVDQGGWKIDSINCNSDYLLVI